MSLKNRKHKKKGIKKISSTTELLLNTRLFRDNLNNELNEISSKFESFQQEKDISHQNDNNIINKSNKNEIKSKTFQSNKEIINMKDMKEMLGSTFLEIEKKFVLDENSEKMKNIFSNSDSEIESSEEEWEREDYNEKDLWDDNSENQEEIHIHDLDENDYASHLLSRLSKKKIKKLARPSVAELKKIAIRPEVVEQHDENSPDALLLIHLKSSRNSVQVPQHWSLDRKYLSSKRGFEKPPFELPDFIKDTGIQEIREKYEKKLQGKSAKAIAKERMRAKLTKTDIDYQILHDAFFKYAKKPPLTIHGDIYYEGKENLAFSKQFKPGQLSEELKSALGMPENSPPPWLIHMQKHGPPPSYPYLKIPGLNSPIPSGAKWGFQPGGWGKPPLDNTGKPLYGDIFSEKSSNEQKQYEYFGSIQDDFESSDDESIIDENNENISEDIELINQNNTITNNNIIITSITKNLERSKELMTILKEEKVSILDEEGILNTEKRYILPEGYIKNIDIPNTQFNAQVEKSEDMDMDDWIQRKDNERIKYAATEDQINLIEEESRKRKRKEIEKEKERKKLKF